MCCERRTGWRAERHGGVACVHVGDCAARDGVSGCRVQRVGHQSARPKRTLLTPKTLRLCPHLPHGQRDL
jgi:hypothetical protein